MDGLSGVWEVLSRLFLGRVKVRSWRGGIVCQVLTLMDSRPVVVRRISLDPKVQEASFVRWSRLRAAGVGRWLFDPREVRVLGRLKSYRATVRGIPFGRGCSMRDAVGLARSLPQERSNRVRYCAIQMKGAIVMAVFSPIMKELVKRSVLDKRSGRLLLWYHEGDFLGRRGGTDKPARLLMVRVFGADEPISWVWL